jgi:trimeric autotransporter adhesin
MASAQVQITQLPSAGTITGNEAVPIVQNGVTVQTTTGAIAASPTQTQTFLTKNLEPTLPNSRYFSTDGNFSLTDGGAQSYYRLELTGLVNDLNTIGTGVVAKDSSNNLQARTLSTSGGGITVADGNGSAGNPTFSLTGISSAIANIGVATGLLSIQNGTTATAVNIVGTADQISVANGNGTGNPTIAIANNPVLSGTEGFTVPAGTSAERPAVPNNGEIRYNTSLNRLEAYVNGAWATMGSGDGSVTSVSGTAGQIAVANGSTTPVVSIATDPTLPGTAYVKLPTGGTADRPVSPSNGMIRYNTDTSLFEGYLNGAWTAFSSAGVGVLSINTGTGLTGGPITSSGTISIQNTAVTAGSYTAANITVNAQGQLTAASSNASLVSTFSAGTTGLTPSSATSGAVTLGGTLIPANGGTGVGSLTGYVYGNGTTAMTASTTIPTTDLSGTVSNAQLANSSVTVGTTNIALGATSLTLGGLTSVAVTQDPVSNLQVATKQYVDGLTSTGLVYHQPVQAGTTASLASTTGGTVTYNNGTAGVGATITLSIPLLILDGYTLLNTNRILIKNEVNQAYNGVYTWATGGTVLTRATDADTYGNSVNQLSQNDYFFTQNGTVNKGTSYVVTTVGTITFGTTAITFAEFSSSLVYTGTSPIDVSGTVISLTTVPATLGGTGQTSYGTGDLLYASNSTTLSKRAIGTEGYALRVTSGVPDWQLLSTGFPITLHSGVTVVDVPIANGFFPVLLHNGVTSVNVTCF